MGSSPAPAPPGLPLLGNLWSWTFHPLHLLTTGAATARAATTPGTAPTAPGAGGGAGAGGDGVFRLRLWREVLVGWGPEWNRDVLGDTDTFRSRGSLSTLTPYLGAGIIRTDQPAHRPRRRELNPHFTGRALAGLAGPLTELATAHRPEGTVEALAWAAPLVRRMLNHALFGGALPDDLLATFLAPLDRRLPATLRRRPFLFARMDRAIRAALADPVPGSIAAGLDLPDAAEELRVALAAGYDTTAHTLAWAVWHLGGLPEWQSPELLDAVIDETLRLYPAGWIGSRVAARDTVAGGVRVPAGTMVLYSPYLTHRDPELWPDPLRFDPERFLGEGRRGWVWVPFAAGARSCLGARLARVMVRAALVPLCAGVLRAEGGDPAPRAGLTLRPGGALPVRWLRR